MSDATDNIEFHEGEPNRGDAFIEKLNRMAEGSLLALLAQAGGGIGLKKTPGGGMYFYLDPPIQGAADVPQATHDNPYTMPSGTDATAETTTWSKASPPMGTDSIIGIVWYRQYYDNSVSTLYAFTRTPGHDSLGGLFSVSAEVRSVVFESGCS